uniref:Protein kinase domain-containing protein n=1 Tax=Cynoglossus semilaevis TaxID=244447 RepID=A0A3P8VRC4_CYNSE
INREQIQEKLLGRGAFGYVYLCTRSDTEEMVAVKTILEEDTEFAEDEVRNLKKLQQFDPDQNCLVRFNRYQEIQKNYLLEFEKLDMNVQDFLEQSSRPLHLSEIQVITQQMLVALKALKSIQMVHGDIKLDNIMWRNQQLEPRNIKLIDFGVAQDVCELRCGDILQLLPQRAPEVLLGLPLSEAVDMWALGSVIASLYINNELYSSTCELAKLDDIVQFHGNISTSSTTSGKSTARHEDTQAFVSLLKQILEVDPRKRISPSEALLHPFLTLTNFPSDLTEDLSDNKAAASISEIQPMATNAHNVHKVNRTAAERDRSEDTTDIKTSPNSAVPDKIITDEGFTASNHKSNNGPFRNKNRFVSWFFRCTSFTGCSDQDFANSTNVELTSPNHRDNTTPEKDIGLLSGDNSKKRRPLVARMVNYIRGELHLSTEKLRRYFSSSSNGDHCSVVTGSV